jgi:hypothetical protein
MKCGAARVKWMKVQVFATGKLIQEDAVEPTRGVVPRQKLFPPNPLLRMV